MSQLRLLLKIQVLSLFDINNRLHSGKQAMAGIVAVALAALILVALVVAYTVTIAQSLVAFELANYIPLLAFALAVTIVIFPTFLKANGTLFALKDFDQIISMPIPVRTVVLSRLIPLFAINVAISAVIIIPMMAVYSDTDDPNDSCNTFCCSYRICERAVPLCEPCDERHSYACVGCPRDRVVWVLIRARWR